MRTTMTTPRYESYQESKISAFSGAIVVAFGRRKARDDGLEDFLGADPFLGARENRSRGRKPDDVFDLSACLLRLCARQIDLVDDRDDLEAVVHREIRVGQRLCLDTLRCIDEQERSFAGGQRARDLVREIDVPRRVDQVEDVFLAVTGLVVQPDRMRLDRDSSLALEVHRIEDLRFHLTGLQSAPVNSRKRSASVDLP